MKVNKIDHICMCVKDLAAAQKMWSLSLGKMAPTIRNEDALSKIRVARYWIGESGFELMEDLDGTGDVAKWIEPRGERQHHRLPRGQHGRSGGRAEGQGLQLHQVRRVRGTHPFRDCVHYSFVHPKQTNGILVELIDYSGKSQEVARCL